MGAPEAAPRRTEVGPRPSARAGLPGREASPPARPGPHLSGHPPRTPRRAGGSGFARGGCARPPRTLAPPPLAAGRGRGRGRVREGPGGRRPAPPRLQGNGRASVLGTRQGAGPAGHLPASRELPGGPREAARPGCGEPAPGGAPAAARAFLRPAGLPRALSEASRRAGHPNAAGPLAAAVQRSPQRPPWAEGRSVGPTPGSTHFSFPPPAPPHSARQPGAGGPVTGQRVEDHARAGRRWGGGDPGPSRGPAPGSLETRPEAPPLARRGHAPPPAPPRAGRGRAARCPLAERAPGTPRPRASPL